MADNREYVYANDWLLPHYERLGPTTARVKDEILSLNTTDEELEAMARRLNTQFLAEGVRLAHTQAVLNEFREDLAEWWGDE